MSLEEVARATRVPLASMERIEAGQFDELPGEVFVRGFLRSYARAVDIPCDEVLARYTASRRTACVAGPAPLGEAPSGTAFDEEAAFIEFALFAGVERRDRAVIAHHPGPDFAAHALAVVQLDGGRGGGDGGGQGLHRISSVGVPGAVPAGWRPARAARVARWPG